MYALNGQTIQNKICLPPCTSNVILILIYIYIYMTCSKYRQTSCVFLEASFVFKHLTIETRTLLTSEKCDKMFANWFVTQFDILSLIIFMKKCTRFRVN